MCVFGNVCMYVCGWVNVDVWVGVQGVTRMCLCNVCISGVTRLCVRVYLGNVCGGGVCGKFVCVGLRIKDDYFKQYITLTIHLVNILIWIQNAEVKNILLIIIILSFKKHSLLCRMT